MRTSILTLVGMLLPAIAGAQQPQRTPLEEAEMQVGAGIFDEARTLLDAWVRANPNPARNDQEQQARYHLLAGRLTTNADSAEDHYLTVAVNYPTSRSAPEALLRLAQARHARGDTQQAITYLRRLLADYPQSDQRPMAGVWLARVQQASGANADLCGTLRGIQPGTNPEASTLLKTETTRVCAQSSRAAATPANPPAPRSEQPRAETTRTDTARAAAPVAVTRPVEPAPAPAAAAGRLSIQVGAFRELSGARSVKSQLERAGITDVRLVQVPGNRLIRVRIGRFANRSAAAAVLAQLAAANMSAVLVTDTDAEQIVR